MYLKRKIDSFLENWKKGIHHLPLIVKGARQIGKTESILHFAKTHYSNIIYINFVTDAKFKQILVTGYETDSILKNVSLINPDLKFVTNNTLFFFDEIQEFPEIATALKFFSLDGRYDCICSGSLLGINYSKIESNSVGYKTDYQMFSLDFEEFLWARGYGDDAVSNLLSHMKNLLPFSSLEHEIFSELFMEFCTLGGMPAIVKQFVSSKNYSGTLEMQRQLILDYKEDIRKYAIGMDQTRILNAFNSIPAQLAKENKKFQLAVIEKGARFKDYRGCIEWLADSGIISMCYCLNNAELPLKGNADINKFKVYFSDTGLLVALLDDEAQEDLRVNKNLGIYKGALFENIVAEALKKSGYDLFYYKKENSTLEEDFFVRTKGKLVPIEVKATNGKNKSLTELVSNERYSDISFGIKFCNGNIGLANHVFTFPYFCSFLLKRYLSE